MEVDVNIVVNFVNLIKKIKQNRNEKRREFLESQQKKKLKKEAEKEQAAKGQQLQQPQQQQQLKAADQNASVGNKKKKKGRADDEPSASPKKKKDEYLLSPLKEPTGQPNTQYRDPAIPLDQWARDPNTFKFTQNNHTWLYQAISNNATGEFVYNFPPGRNSIRPTDIGSVWVTLVPRWDYILSEGCTLEGWFYRELYSNMTFPTLYIGYGGYSDSVVVDLNIEMPKDYPNAIISNLANASINVSYGYSESGTVVEGVRIVLYFLYYSQVIGNTYAVLVLDFNNGIRAFIEEGWNHAAFQISKDRTMMVYLNGKLMCAVYRDGSFYTHPSASSVSARDDPYSPFTGKFNTSAVFANDWKKVGYLFKYEPYIEYTVNSEDKPRGYFRGVRLTTRQRYFLNEFQPVQYL
jgi:hypothetical protein